MRLEDLLTANCVRRGVRAHSRKRALDMAADLFAEQREGVAVRPLFDALMERERLGSTGIGKGVAIPHCRLECPAMMAVFLTLEQPVDYDAPDEEPVDLIFVLVVPQEETSAHLEILSLLAKIFGDAANRARLRQAASSEALAAEIFNAALRAGAASPSTP